MGIEEVFGENHEVFIGVELTKFHEKHYKDTVNRLRQQIELEYEGTRLKGEITLIISPFQEDSEA